MLHVSAADLLCKHTHIHTHTHTHTHTQWVTNIYINALCVSECVRLSCLCITSSVYVTSQGLLTISSLCEKWCVKYISIMQCLEAFETFSQSETTTLTTFCWTNVPPTVWSVVISGQPLCLVEKCHILAVSCIWVHSFSNWSYKCNVYVLVLTAVNSHMKVLFLLFVCISNVLSELVSNFVWLFKGNKWWITLHYFKHWIC